MQQLTETAYAKLNLALHVRARRDDGYHDIETVFAFAGHGDTITVQQASGLSLLLDGPFSHGLTTGPDNLVLLAANALREQSGTAKGARIALTKNLPVASGIGGGSADAAATLRALNRLWQTGVSQDDLIAIAAPLGADVAACVASRTCTGTGTGTYLSFADDVSLQDLHIVLVNPGISLPTGPVFAAWDGQDRGGLPGEDDILAIALQGRNDLEMPAVTLVPEIAFILKRLRSHTPALARMSGSGATCFALFRTLEAASVACKDISKKWPEYWMMQSVFRTECDA